MRFFLAGIMQGSHLGAVLHSQNYRERLKELLAEHFPGAQVYDPLADHGQSLDYTDATARDVFYFHNRMCREVDVVIAFVPEASMGTAIEMWEAHEHGRAVVLAISPLGSYSAILKRIPLFGQLLSGDRQGFDTAVFESLDLFEAAVRDGRIAEIVESRIRSFPTSQGT